MNPEIMTVADEMTTDELARYLIEHEISDAPVVDSHLVESATGRSSEHLRGSLIWRLNTAEMDLHDEARHPNTTSKE